MKQALFNHFWINLSDEAVAECHHQGQCDKDVENWQDKIDLSHISDEILRDELREYGAWDEAELQDRRANEQRIIWLAAGNIQDEEHENEQHNSSK